MSDDAFVTDPETLREKIGQPQEFVLNAIKPALDHFHVSFIEKSPFCCVATSDAEGFPTVSPRGDAPGFVKVLDNNQLLLPDRPGNRKAESFHNLLDNPKIGLIFLVPGLREALRVNGTAQISRDPELLEMGRVRKSIPKTTTIITVNRVYFHCGKAVLRSKLWDASTQLELDEFPAFVDILKEQAKLEVSADEGKKMMEDEYKNKLY